LNSPFANNFYPPMAKLFIRAKVLKPVPTYSTSLYLQTTTVQWTRRGCCRPVENLYKV